MRYKERETICLLNTFITKYWKIKSNIESGNRQSVIRLRSLYSHIHTHKKTNIHKYIQQKNTNTMRLESDLFKIHLALSYYFLLLSLYNGCMLIYFIATFKFLLIRMSRSKNSELIAFSLTQFLFRLFILCAFEINRLMISVFEYVL